MPTLAQNARCDKAVPAIVPGPGHHQYRPPVQARRDGIGDRPPGRLHQRHSRNTASNREAVRFPHFLASEQFEHAGTLVLCNSIAKHAPGAIFASPPSAL